MTEKVKPGYHGASWGTGPRLAFPPLLANPPRAGVDVGPVQTDLVVACVNVGTKFPSYYVDRLFNSVSRNLTIPFRFQVLTDVHREDYQTSPLHQVKVHRPALTGWYSKINLFDPHVITAGVRVLYLDLDVVITGSLDELVMCREPFVMIREFAGNTVNAAHNSSVMSWTAGGETRDIYERFEDEWMNRSWGDQECIWKIMGNDRIWDWPEHWVRSYKYHPGTPQPHTKVMVFHGDPKPDAVTDQWVLQNWR